MDHPTWPDNASGQVQVMVLGPYIYDPIQHEKTNPK